MKIYKQFQKRVDEIKIKFLRFLIEQKLNGKSVIGIGAAAKANTLLNYSGIKPDLLPFIFDNSRSKQGYYMPGSHIPILSPKYVTKKKIDYFLIFPWNISSEIKEQYSKIKNNRIKFLVAFPELKIL